MLRGLHASRRAEFGTPDDTRILGWYHTIEFASGGKKQVKLRRKGNGKVPWEIGTTQTVKFTGWTQNSQVDPAVMTEKSL
jgi:hypothetical protein